MCHTGLLDELDVTCLIISLFNAQHVSNVSTSILRSLWLICWVISWVVLLWYDVLVLRCGSAGVVWFPYAGFSLHKDNFNCFAGAKTIYFHFYFHFYTFYTHGCLTLYNIFLHTSLGQSLFVILQQQYVTFGTSGTKSAVARWATWRNEQRTSSPSAHPNPEFHIYEI